MENQPGVILIGMPGAGKSTLGVQLAKELGFDFVDTDVSIQVHTGQTLQDIIDSSDYLNLRRIEEAVLLKTDCHDMVVATGGSAVYSDPGMNHLKQQGTVVFLDTPLEELRRRIHNYDSRGIARRPDQTLEDVFAERQALYEKYADITVLCDGLDQHQALESITKQLAARSS
ncbi:shikimate kinase [bacterium SCSIO 12696]|nr:shikimate kinase [bacterium SCSIO 12696]